MLTDMPPSAVCANSPNGGNANAEARSYGEIRFSDGPAVADFAHKCIRKFGLPGFLSTVRPSWVGFRPMPALSAHV